MKNKEILFFKYSLAGIVANDCRLAIVSLIQNLLKKNVHGFYGDIFPVSP